MKGERRLGYAPGRGGDGIATRYCVPEESYRAFINRAGWFLETRLGARRPLTQQW